MHRARFRRVVEAAVAAIPPEFAEQLDNVEILVRMRPTAEERAEAGIGPRDQLLGLYVGHPLTDRGSYYGNTLPDRIMIYQEAIESICRSDEELLAQVRRTVLHEIAHHFGIDDERLHEIGAY
ncbi:MAG: metallopeptidase family protein [Chloroflexota bacterium]|nr:metallopeptidase family protein [Chloroflexota bacterium]MXY78162.1 metallopeptidase family protein [Chloroflexota bacterium]